MTFSVSSESFNEDNFNSPRLSSFLTGVRGSKTICAGSNETQTFCAVVDG